MLQVLICGKGGKGGKGGVGGGGRGTGKLAELRIKLVNFQARNPP